MFLINPNKIPFHLIALLLGFDDCFYRHTTKCSENDDFFLYFRFCNLTLLPTTKKYMLPVIIYDIQKLPPCLCFHLSLTIQF